MQYIGFANKFWTLWEVNDENITTPWGVRKVIHHTYIKNISMDKEKALGMYPDVPVDMTLKGSSSWDSYEGEKIPDTKFAYGKYMGQDIADCDDINYLAYMFSMFWGKGREIVMEKLENAGYHFTDKDAGVFVTKERWEEIEASMIRARVWAESFAKMGYIDVLMEKNLDEMGGYFKDALDLHFDSYVEMAYAGYRYGLPAINGKGKRVKGKTLRIYSDDAVLKDEPWGSCFWVLVNKFEILK